MEVSNVYCATLKNYRTVHVVADTFSEAESKLLELIDHQDNESVYISDICLINTCIL